MTFGPMTWEYQVLVAEDDPNGLTERLNDEGKDGWELVGTGMVKPALYGKEGGDRVLGLFLRRPLGPAS
jgi:hypothetical protein